MGKLSIALCGCFGHVEKFGDLINSYPESEIVAVWDNVPGRGEEVARHLNCPFEGDYARLLRNYRLDGVAIVAENSLHKDMIIQAARQHTHIFVEKPLCVSAEDAREIQAVIHETGVHFYMTDPFVRSGTIRLKELLAEGLLGEVTTATFHLATDAALNGHVNYRKDQTGGGIMADIGGHMIHQAHYLFGKPKCLSATLGYVTEQSQANGVEETALVSMEYPDHKLVSLECSWVSGTSNSYELVCGTRGWARITPAGGAPSAEKLVYQLNGEPAVTLEGDALPPSPTRHVRYWVEMMDRDIPNDRVGVDPLSNSGVSIDNAVEYVEIIEAIYRSAGQGRAFLD